MTHGSSLICLEYNLGFMDILKSNKLYSVIANIHFQTLLHFVLSVFKCVYVHVCMY